MKGLACYQKNKDEQRQRQQRSNQNCVPFSKPIGLNFNPQTQPNPNPLILQLPHTLSYSPTNPLSKNTRKKHTQKTTIENVKYLKYA